MANSVDKAPVSPSKEELEKALRELMPRFDEFLSNITGTQVRVAATKRGISEAADFMLSLLKWQKASNEAKDESEQKQLTQEFFDIMSEATYGRKIENAVDVFIAELAQPFLDPPKSSFFAKTKFTEYREALLKIISQIFEKEKVNEVNDLHASIDESVYGMGQLSIKIENEAKYLKKDPSKPTGKVIRKYLSIYDDLCGLTEHHVRILYGVREILRGQSATYAELKKERLANLANSLKNEKPYSVLLNAFNVVVRNALAHKGSVAIQPMKKSVRFTDVGKEVNWTYDTVIRQTRELRSALRVMALLSQGMTLAKFFLAKEQLES